MVVDLSCDQIRYDAARDKWRFEVRPASIPDSQLSARDQARLLFRGFNYTDSTLLDRVFRVMLTSSETGRRYGDINDSSHVNMELPPGGYSLHVTCLGCSRADTTIRTVAGTVDTIDAYLTRFPNSCEADAER